MVAPCLRKLPCSRRNLEGSRHVNDSDIVWICPTLPQRQQCAIQQALSNEGIKPARDDGELLARCIQRRFQPATLSRFLRVGQEADAKPAHFHFEKTRAVRRVADLAADGHAKLFSY